MSLLFRVHPHYVRQATFAFVTAVAQGQVCVPTIRAKGSKGLSKAVLHDGQRIVVANVKVNCSVVIQRERGSCRASDG